MAKKEKEEQKWPHFAYDKNKNRLVLKEYNKSYY